ncbi:hypothetical protein F3Y22_tig00109957pilonHSYRG00251 [Hibiscus syriacus]|uniref:RNase H type-1 domain-containing protein n=1 Tax=Hibiscus syriacus TaxID=106335 RepID=A0A6A3BSM5_HIBSY|nr:hypothetical protein F3Y22_tig00109957pilonHSYRG00251 [Hibiscus syriacus]
MSTEDFDVAWDIVIRVVNVVVNVVLMLSGLVQYLVGLSVVTGATISEEEDQGGEERRVMKRSITWTRYYYESMTISTTTKLITPTQVHWNAPDPSWICLNVDGLVSSATGFGSIGGVFRDHEGSWILGFNKSIGITSPLQAELWAIFIRLQLAWDNGFELL